MSEQGWFDRAVYRLLGPGSRPYRAATRQQQRHGWKPGRYGYSPSLHMADGGPEAARRFQEAFDAARRAQRERE